MTIRVLLADDQALLRATFRMLIDSCEDMTVVGEASDGAEAVELARAHHPDIVLMDIRMPGMDGLAATSAICADPELSATRVLVLTTFETEDYVAQALHAGASGFLGKDVTTDTLLAGLRTVASGEHSCPHRHRTLIAKFLMAPAPARSSRPHSACRNSPLASAKRWPWPPRACPTPRSPRHSRSAR